MRPRPMNRTRLVSHSVGDTLSPSRLRTWNTQARGSFCDRGLRPQMIAVLSGRYSVCTNSLPKAGWATSSSSAAEDDLGVAGDVDSRGGGQSDWSATADGPRRRRPAETDDLEHRLDPVVSNDGRRALSEPKVTKHSSGSFRVGKNVGDQTSPDLTSRKYRHCPPGSSVRSSRERTIEGRASGWSRHRRWSRPSPTSRWTGTARAGGRCVACGIAARGCSARVHGVRVDSTGRGGVDAASRGMRSCSNSSVALTCESAWKRSTITLSSSCWWPPEGHAQVVRHECADDHAGRSPTGRVASLGESGPTRGV